MIVVSPLAAGAFALIMLVVAAVFTWLQESAQARDARCRWDSAEMVRAADRARWDAHAAQWEAEMKETSR